MIPAAVAAQHLKEASSRAEKNREKKKKKAPENPKESCKDRENPAGGIQNIPKDPDRISNTFKTWRYQEDP